MHLELASSTFGALLECTSCVLGSSKLEHISTYLTSLIVLIKEKNPISIPHCLLSFQKGNESAALQSQFLPVRAVFRAQQICVFQKHEAFANHKVPVQHSESVNDSTIDGIQLTMSIRCL